MESLPNEARAKIKKTTNTTNMPNNESPSRHSSVHLSRITTTQRYHRHKKLKTRLFDVLTFAQHFIYTYEIDCIKSFCRVPRFSYVTLKRGIHRFSI